MTAHEGWTKKGQQQEPELSRDATARVIHGDCLAVMPTLAAERVDAIVTDPPYGIGATRMTLGNGQRRVYRGESHWDDAAPDLAHVLAMDVPTVIWGGNYFALPPEQKWLVWDKGTGDNDFADCELAWTNADGAVRKFFRSWVGANAKERGDHDRFHPTQKPIALMRWCIQQLRLPANSLILDPYCGSGTTGIAAVLEGHRFIGIEHDAAYVAIARQRIAAASDLSVPTGEQSSLFMGDDEEAA